jgi:hypothetical protein
MRKLQARRIGFAALPLQSHPTGSLQGGKPRGTFFR